MRMKRVMVIVAGLVTPVSVALANAYVHGRIP